LGLGYLEKVNYERALASFEEARNIFLTINSTNAIAMSKNLNELGKVHLLSNRLEYAEDHFL